MMRRIDLRGAVPVSRGGTVDYRDVVPRADFDIEAATPAVHAICEAVRTRGLEAVLEMSQQYDGVTQTDIRVPSHALRDALTALDPDIRAGLEESIRRLRATCEAEVERDAVTDLGAGARVTHRKVPVGRVGLYVPGGIAPLVSSVLMNVVPAQVAGVRSIALSSTPQKEHGGLPHPTILAACALLGVDEVYAVGGAQAIAMFAYGVGPCARVDLVTGPGLDLDGHRQAAAQGPGRDRLRGRAHRDPGPRRRDGGPGVRRRRPAQPGRARPARRSGAGDRLRAPRRPRGDRARGPGAGHQAHRADPELAVREPVRRSCWWTTSTRASTSPTRTPPSTSRSTPPTRCPWPRRIRNAGAIFVGPHAPVSLGDYCAGSNHVLPTGGCACHSSGLSVRAFTKSVHVVDYSREALAEVADHVVTLAEAEDLPGHGAAVRVRFGSP